MRFGQLLKQYIDDSETSVRLFSKITDLNRGWLYNIFSGKKKLSEDKFHKMLDHFPFSDAQKTLLRDAYYEELYGVNAFNKIQFIISELKSLSKNDDSKYCFPNYVQTYNSNVSFINNKYNLFDSICYLLRTSSLKDNSLIYTNFSYAQEEIDTAMYSCLLEKQDITFSHIVNFDNRGNDVHNLRNIFRSLKYAKHKINTYFYYDNNHLMQLDSLFPYFIVTNAGVLLYNNSMDNGLLILDKSVINEFSKKAENILKQCTPLVKFPDNIFSLKEYLLQNVNCSYTDSISSRPCLTGYLNVNMLDSIINESIPNREYTIHSIYEWIKVSDFSTNSILHLNTTQGFSDFAQNGHISYFSTKYAKPLSIKNRIKILKKCIETNESQHAFCLLDDNKVTLPDDIRIELFPPGTNLIYGYLENHDFSDMGSFVILLSNNVMFSDFNNFKDYITRNNFYLNDKYTQLFFKDLLLKLETIK